MSYYPYSVVHVPSDIVGGGGLLYMTCNDQRIRSYNVTSQSLSIVAGYGTASHRDGAATFAYFYTPRGLDYADPSVLYIADQSNHRIRKVDLSTSKVFTVAGTGSYGYFDGMATSVARLYNPWDIAVFQNASMSAPVVYFVDYGSHRIREVRTNPSTSTNWVNHVAGSGSASHSDGPVASAMFYYPYGLCVHAVGGQAMIYVADRNNHVTDLLKCFNSQGGHNDRLHGCMFSGDSQSGRSCRSRDNSGWHAAGEWEHRWFAVDGTVHLSIGRELGSHARSAVAADSRDRLPPGRH